MKLSDTHDLQKQSVFSLYRMPEQTRDLEITASLMRSLMGVGEGAGLSEAPEFSTRIYTQDIDAKAEQFDNCSQAWLGQILLAKGLEVPPSEREKLSATGSVMSLVPLTPAVAKYCCFTRKSGNPWNPGAYIQGMLLRGARDLESATDRWSGLAMAFSLCSSEDGHRRDSWATVVEEAALAIMGEETWDGIPNEMLRASKGWASYPGDWVNSLPAYPASSFVTDIEILEKLEGVVTRRTWIGIIDCYLRLAISADMLWVGRINRGLEKIIRETAQLGSEIDLDESWFLSRLLDSFNPIDIGNHCESILRQEVREFGKSQLFTRAYLDSMPKQHIDEITASGGLSSLSGLRKLADFSQKEGEGAVVAAEFDRGQILDANPNMMSLKGRKTWTHQLYFALRYGLGQRSASEANRHFDQGYWCRKSGPARAHPWCFEISPVGVTLMVHLVTAGKYMATARDLQSKLNEYGIGVSMAEISRGSIGLSLRRLGLVTDSPDAEGGMVLRSPFLEREQR